MAEETKKIEPIFIETTEEKLKEAIKQSEKEEEDNGGAS